MRRALLIGVAALIAWIVCALFAPGFALAGWMQAVIALSTPLIGSVVLVLVSRLTGGRWAGYPLRLAAGAPALLVLAIPLVLGVGWIYPWASPTGASEGMLALAFGVLTMGALAVYASLAWALRQGRMNAPRAGVALVLHAALVTALGLAWILSLQPGWASTAIGLNVAAQQVAAAGAIGALMAQRDAQRGPAIDLTVLGAGAGLIVAYLGFMDFLIVWYGDLPDKVAWYAPRLQGGWAPIPGLAAAIFVAGVAVGVVRPAARVIAPAIAVLVALALYQVWLTAPQAPLGAPAAAVPALAAQAMLTLWALRRARRPSHD